MKLDFAGGHYFSRKVWENFATTKKKRYKRTTIALAETSASKFRSAKAKSLPRCCPAKAGHAKA